MKQEITITRNSRNIGWGFCSWTPERPEPPARPDHTGTVKQVLDAIDHDRDYASYQSGGTYHTAAWFVKLNGRWHRIEFGDVSSPADLLWTDDGFWGKPKFLCDKITGTIEIDDAAASLGRRGGSKTSERKAIASRENGKRGGRPRKE